MYPNVRKRVLVFKQLEYIISDWSGDRYPSVIYLCVDGIDGYIGKDDIMTTRVAAL